MLIKCTECGFENQLGAIFCRECGAKLDVDKMRPEIKEKRMNISFGDLIRNITALVVLGGLFYAIGMMFYPEPVQSLPLGDNEKKQAETKLQSLINKIAGEPEEDTYTFTPEEVTYLYNNKLMASDDNAADMEPVDFSLDPQTDEITLLTGSSVMGIDVTYSITGMLVDDQLDFEVTGAKMGHLPIPGFLQNKIIEKFTAGIDEGSIKDILDATEKLVIKDGAFQITIKEKTK